MIPVALNAEAYFAEVRRALVTTDPDTARRIVLAAHRCDTNGVRVSAMQHGWMLQIEKGASQGRWSYVEECLAAMIEEERNT